jgi:hypothetical protein
MTTKGVTDMRGTLRLAVTSRVRVAAVGVGGPGILTFLLLPTALVGGGLATAALLSLFVLPVLYLRFAKPVSAPGGRRQATGVSMREEAPTSVS